MYVIAWLHQFINIIYTVTYRLAVPHKRLHTVVCFIVVRYRLDLAISISIFIIRWHLCQQSHHEEYICIYINNPTIICMTTTKPCIQNLPTYRRYFVHHLESTSYARTIRPKITIQYLTMFDVMKTLLYIRLLTQIFRWNARLSDPCVMLVSVSWISRFFGVMSSAWMNTNYTSRGTR